jgi:hypothetical protein
VDKKIQGDRIHAPVIIGIIAAILLSFSPGSFFILVLTVGVAFLICQFSDRRERNFILAVFLAGLGIRIGATLLASSWSIFSGHILNYAAHNACPDYSTPYIFDDSGYYTLRALFTSMYWQGEPMSEYAVEAIVQNAYGLSGFIYVLAGFFRMFGYSPIASRFINSFFGSLTIILVYSITKNIFNERPARLAAILTAIFPSVFLWSITNLKETSMMFAAFLTIWSLVKFQKKKSIYYLIAGLLSIWFQGFIRFTYGKEFVVITVFAVLFYIFYLGMTRLILRRRIAVFLLIFMIGSAVVVFKREQACLVLKGSFAKVLTQHRGATGSGGVCYKLLPEEYYTGNKSLNLNDFCKMFGKGWFHVMFEPLPWKTQTKSMLFCFPQMFLWYFLVAFAVPGAVTSLRYRSKESIFLIMYFFLITSGLAVTGGNIGTVFRIRDINTPIVLIFSSIGLVNTFSTLLKSERYPSEQNR